MFRTLRIGDPVSRIDPQLLPPELESAFTAEPQARALFARLAPSHRREYLEWIRGARQDATRERRAAQTVIRLLNTAARTEIPHPDAE